MKLILCIQNQTLQETLIPDPVVNFENEQERITRHEEYVKHAVTEMKVKYDKIIKSRPWEIYLVVESKMNGRKKFVERMKEECSKPIT